MVFLACMILCCWIFERLLAIVEKEGDPLKEEELLKLKRLCVLSSQVVSNIFRKSLKFLTNLDIPVSLSCSFPLFKCLLTLMVSCEIWSILLFSQNSFKGTLMQIWKPPYMFVFIWKQYPGNFAFLILRILELFTRKDCKFLKK